MKAIETVYLVQSDGNLPIEVHTAKGTAQRSRERQRVWPYNDEARYADADVPSVRSQRNFAYFNGDTMFINPKPSADQNVQIDAYRWMADYTADTDTDFVVQNGFEFLMWSCVVELNHTFKTMSPQKENTISPPTNLRDRALAQFIKWDKVRIEGGRIPRLR